MCYTLEQLNVCGYLVCSMLLYVCFKLIDISINLAYLMIIAVSVNTFNRVHWTPTLILFVNLSSTSSSEYYHAEIHLSPCWRLFLHHRYDDCHNFVRMECVQSDGPNNASNMKYCNADTTFLFFCFSAHLSGCLIIVTEQSGHWHWAHATTWVFSAEGHPGDRTFSFSLSLWLSYHVIICSLICHFWFTRFYNVII